METAADNPDPEDHFLTRSKIGSILLITFLLATLVGVFLIIMPYLHGIILGGLFASLCRPVYRYVLRKTKNRANLAAALTCALVALLVLVPLLSFSSVLIVRGRNSFLTIQTWFEEGSFLKELKTFGLVDEEATSILEDDELSLNEDAIIDPETTSPDNQLSPLSADTAAVSDSTLQTTPSETKTEPPEAWKQRVGRWLLRQQKRYFPNMDIVQLQKLVINKSQGALEYLAPGAWSLVQKGVGLIVNFAIMLFVMFYCFRDGHKIMDYLLELSPLGEENENLLIKRIRSVTRSAVMGTVLTAVVQGALAMVAFAVVGIPWFFWGVLLGVASLIPVVGTALVWVPCCLYLLLIGSYGKAIGLAIWCMVAVGLSDNFLRPVLMRGDTGMNPLIAFFAILGGIQLFGLIGVIYGPLIFGLCAILLYIYKLETNGADSDDEVDRPDPPAKEPLPASAAAADAD